MSCVNIIKIIITLKPRALKIVDHKLDIRRNPVRLYGADCPLR
jgi:hypothetical protein